MTTIAASHPVGDASAGPPPRRAGDRRPRGQPSALASSPPRAPFPSCRCDPAHDRPCAPPPPGHRVPARCAHMDGVHTWSVVVPAKRLAVAKTRLRPLTDRRRRESHADARARPAGRHGRRRRWRARVVDTVLVVTDDPAAAAEVVPAGRAHRRRRARQRAEPGARARRAGSATARPSPRSPPTCPRCAPTSSPPRSPAADAAPRCFVADAARHRDDAAHRRRHGAAPAFGTGVGGGAPRRRRGRADRRVARAASATSTPRPTCAPRWRWAPAVRTHVRSLGRWR